MSILDEMQSVAGAVPAPPVRPALRGAPRAAVPRDAAARAAQLRQHFVDNPTDIDKFDAARLQPPEWTYEWKRKSIYNKDDPTYATMLVAAGWDAVPVDRHPEMMPPDYRGTTIEREGLILCERPTVIVQEAKNRDLQKARVQVRAREETLLNQTPKGGAPRNHAKVGVTYGRDGIAVDD